MSMAHPRGLRPFRLPLTVDGVPVDVAGLQRDGTGTPLVFLHGFGSTKEDYADVVHQAALAGRPVLAYDAPGCGATICLDLSAVSVPFLVSVAAEVLRAMRVDRCHLVGHSMGGLTALLLADSRPARVAGFVDIEGNVAPEDCFLSRQIQTHPEEDPADFLARPAKVRAEVVRPIFSSMVELSDSGGLMERFLALPFPRMFMYGAQNSALSYLGELTESGVELAEIPHSEHFPMYSNPPEMWSRITDFVGRADAGEEQ
jgi:pimeloyl-ACP methyl ester carboxylesterase